MTTYTPSELARQLVASGNDPAVMRPVADDAAVHPAVADICQLLAAVASAALDLAAQWSGQPRDVLIAEAFGSLADPATER